MLCSSSGAKRHEQRRSFALWGTIAFLFLGSTSSIDSQTSQAPRAEGPPSASACQTVPGDSVAQGAKLSSDLQSQVAGLQIYEIDARAGAGSVIRLRGNNSVSGSNIPLVYVDDIRVPPIQTSTVTRRMTAQSFLNALDMVDPTEVDRIEVLHGPAAAMIYGMDAASGVIRVYTKRGPKGGTAGKGRVRCP